MNKDLDDDETRAKFPAIKRKYRMKELSLVVDSETEGEMKVHAHGEINPKKDGKQGTKENSDDKPIIRPEAKYRGTGKHGVRWKEGKSLAKSGTPQGQWSNSDLDFATEKAQELNPGESDYFELPAGSESVVHNPDGTTERATHIWIRHNSRKGKSRGTFHGYPLIN